MGGTKLWEKKNDADKTSREETLLLLTKTNAKHLETISANVPGLVSKLSQIFNFQLTITKPSFSLRGTCEIDPQLASVKPKKHIPKMAITNCN